MDSSQQNQNPVAGIRYTEGFDQSSIYREDMDLMERMGCAENLKLSKLEESGVVEQCQGSGPFKDCQNKGDYIPLDLGNDISDQERIIKFEAKCLDKINSERKRILLRPAYEQGVFLGVLMTIVGTGCYFVPSALPFALPFIAMDIVWNGKAIGKSVHNWVDTPKHPVDALEIRYALNKCYIPNALWNPIEDEFLIARTNQFSQNSALNYLNFTLGLTVFKPKPPLVLIDKQKGIDWLCDKIDRFFEDYEDFNNSKHLNLIKSSITDFIHGLLGGNERPRYVYLCGSLGIGKTFFVQSVNKWIQKLIPNSTCYFDQKVRTVADLEGGSGKAGVYLSVLKKQCEENKWGSVVLIDEAIWLNDEAFIPSALKTFENSKFPLHVLYTGEGKAEGSNTQLKLSPMLTFVASNGDIKHDALKSRFNFTDYPMPKKKSLFKHAFKEIKKNQSSSLINDLFKENQKELTGKYQKDLEVNFGDINNFRDTETLASGLVTDWKEKQRKEIKRII